MPIDSPFDSLVGIRSPFGNRRASAPPAAPTLSEFSVEEVSDVGELQITTDTDATLYVWIGPTGTTPTAQEIKDGTGADASLSVAITLFGGPYDLTLPNDLDGDYRVSVVAKNGNSPLSNVFTQTPVAFDTLPRDVIAENAFYGVTTAYADSETYTIPALTAGNYLVFSFCGTRSLTTSSTLDGQPLVFEAKKDVGETISVHSVNILGGENIELFMQWSSLANARAVCLVKTGGGTVAETQVVGGEWAPDNIKQSFANTDDGKVIAAYLTNAGAGNILGYISGKELLPKKQQDTLAFAIGRSDHTAGSPTSVDFNLDGMYGTQVYVGAKVT